MPNGEDNLKKLHSNLSNKWDGFNVPLEKFRKDMENEDNLKRLHQSLSDKWEGFSVPYDKFKTDMSPATVQKETESIQPSVEKDKAVEETRFLSPEELQAKEREKELSSIEFKPKEEEEPINLHPEGVEIPEQPQPEEGLESEEALGVLPMNEAELRVKMLREERADAQENSLYKANIDKGMSNMEATIVAKAQKDKVQRDLVKETEAAKIATKEQGRVGFYEDKWNRLKSASTRVASEAIRIPHYINKGSLIVAAEVTGNTKLLDDLNKLSQEERDIVVDAMSAATGRPTEGFRKASDKVKKVADEIAENTRQYEGTVTDAILSGRIGDAVDMTLGGVIESVPYMAEAMVPGGLALIGTQAAGAKLEEKEAEFGLSKEALGTAVVGGLAEAGFEVVTQRMLKRAFDPLKKLAKGNRELSNQIAESTIKKLSKNFGEEATSEALTELTNQVGDKLFLGEDMDWKPISDAFIIGGASGTGIAGAGIGIEKGVSKALKKPQEEVKSDDKVEETVKDEAVAEEEVKPTEEQVDETPLEEQDIPPIEEKVKEEPVEEISDEEYNEFVDKGTVKEETLNSIADKIKEGETLTDREKAIHSDKTAEVEEILKKESVEDEEVEFTHQDGTKTKFKLNEVEVLDSERQDAKENESYFDITAKGKKLGAIHITKDDKSGTAKIAWSLLYNKTEPSTTDNWKEDKNSSLITEFINKVLVHLNLKSDKSGGIKYDKVVVNNQGKGIGTEAYIQLGEKLNKKGIKLQSDRIRSTAAESLWSKLEKNGQAKKIERDAGEPIQEGDKTTYNYEFIKKESIESDKEQQKVDDSVETEQKKESKEEIEADKEDVVKTEPTDGNTVQLPPRIKGGVERTFQFDKGEWKQKVGGELTAISEDLQEELTNKFKGDEVTEEVPTKEGDKVQIPEETKTSERVEEVAEEKIVKPKSKEDARKALKERFKKKGDFKEEVVPKKEPSKITWKKRKPGKPDSKITKRVDPVQESAEKLARGEITNEQYQEVLEANTKREDITDITEPATKDEVINAVNTSKKEQVDLPIVEGTKVGVRPDIPSFFNKGTWVNTVHGEGKSGKVVSHEGATKVKNPVFHSIPKASLEIATKKKWGKDQKPQVWKEDKYDSKGKLIHKKGEIKVADKTPSAGRILGGYSSFGGNTHDAKMQSAKTEIEQVANDPAWTQVSFNPFRGSMYFERSTGRPILGGSEAIVMGSLVYVKDPQYTTKEDPSFEVKGFKDAEGKPVKFQKGQVVRKQNVSTVIDGIIDRTDNKEAKKALNTVKNVVNALSKVAPNQEVVVHENEASYLDAVGEGGKNTSGALDSEGKIHLNLDRSKSNTILHEGSHVVMSAYLKSSPDAVKKFKGQLEKILSKSDKDAFAKLKMFSLGYLQDGESVVDEEFVIEALARISNGEIQIPKSRLDQLLEIIKELAKKVGLDPDSIKLTGKEDIVEFSNKLKEAFGKGKEIDIDTLKPLEEQEQGGSGDVGEISFQKGKPVSAPSVKEDKRSFASLIKDKDIRDFNGKKFITNMYDFTNAGETDLGNGYKINLSGGKNYVPLMMERKGLKLGDKSNLAAFNTRENAEGFINNVKKSGAELFMPHSGTLDGSWQFQHAIFEELTNLVLDNKILSKKALISTFNEAITSKDGKKSFEKFKKKFGKNIKNLNSFISNPKELVELLDIENNMSPDLRKALNDKLIANKKFQEKLGVKSKLAISERMMDPMNKGVQGGELMGVVEFDNTEFEVVKTKKGDVDHHPSFGYTVLAKIKGIFQPTEFHQSTKVTKSYTKHNKDGTVISKPTDSTKEDYAEAQKGRSPFKGTFEEFQEMKFKASNVSSSAGAIPKVATVSNPAEHKVEKGKVKFQKSAKESNLFREENKDVINVSEEYKKAKNITSKRAKKVYELDAENSKSIADAYDAMEHNPSDPKVKEAYMALAEEVQEQYLALEKAGYKLELYEGKGEPYANSKEMLDDLRENKRLYTLSTESDFGEAGVDEKLRSDNPMLNYSSSNDVNGKPLLINDLFRFVHDVFGHGEQGTSFGAIGEENAWMVHSTLFSENARRALTTETRGQNSWVNFGNHMRNSDGSIKNKGDEGYLTAMERPFADQKNGLLPDEFVFTDQAPKFQKGQEASEYIQGLHDYGYLKDTSAEEILEDLQELGIDTDIQTVNTLRDATLGVKEETVKRKAPRKAIYDNDAILSGKEGKREQTIIPEMSEEGKIKEGVSIELTDKEAARIINENSAEEVDAVVRDQSNDMKPVLRTALLRALIKKEKRDNNRDLAEEYGDLIGDVGGDSSVEMRYRQEFANDPEIQTIMVVRSSNKRKEAFNNSTNTSDGKTIGSHVDNSLSEIKNIAAKIGVEVSNLDSVDRIIEKIVAKKISKMSSEKIGVSKAKVKKARAERKKINDDFNKNKGKYFHSTLIPGLTAEGIERLGKLAKTYINEGVANAEIIAEHLREFVRTHTGKELSDKDLQKIKDKYFSIEVKETIEDYKKEIKDVISDHYGKKDELKRTLSQKIQDKLGLDSNEAAKIEKLVNEEFANKMKIESEKELTKLYGSTKIPNKEQTSKKKKDDVDKIVDAMNMGGFNDNLYRDLIGDKFGFRFLTDEDVEMLDRYADDIQNLPIGELRNRRIQDLQTELYKIKDRTKAEEVGNTLMELFYISTLSGFSTVSRALKGALLTSTYDITVTAMTNPRIVHKSLEALLKGMHRFGTSSWASIMKDGYSDVEFFEVKPKHRTKLEEITNKSFKDLSKEEKKAAKMFVKMMLHIPVRVYRVLIANDAMMKAGLAEMHSYVEAYNQELLSGDKNRKEREFWTNLNKKVAMDKTSIKKAEVQAAQEIEALEVKGEKIPIGYKNRRTQEILNNIRDNNYTDSTKNALERANTALLMNDPIGSLGWLYRFVQGGVTLNETDNKVQVILKVLTRVVVSPFIRVATNFINTGIDYAPGFSYLRIAKRTQGGVLKRNGKEKLTPREKTEAFWKAGIGTVISLGLTMAMYTEDDEGDLILDEDSSIQVTGSGPGSYAEGLSVTSDYKKYSFRFKLPTGEWSSWYSYLDNPLGLMLAPHGAVSDQIRFERFKKEAKDKMEGYDKLSHTALFHPLHMIDFAGQQTYAQGINDLTTIFFGKGKLSKREERISDITTRPARGILLPNFYRQFYQQYKAFSGKPQKLTTGYDRMMKDIPLLDDVLSGVDYDVFGYPIIRDFEVPLVPDVILSALKKNRRYRESTPEWGLIHKYPELQLGESPKSPDRLGGRELTNEEKSKYLYIRGNVYRKLFNEGLKNLKKEDKNLFGIQRLIDNTKGKATKEAKKLMFSNK